MSAREVLSHDADHAEAAHLGVMLTLQALSGIAPIATVFLIVFGGIYTGMFTPTEGAAVGAAATFVAALLKREITWDKFKTCFWFGIMVLMTVGFGMLAPPVGLNVYVVNSMAKDVPIAESYRGVMPFLLSDTPRTLLLLFFPAVSPWLVKYIG